MTIEHPRRRGRRAGTVLDRRSGHEPFEGRDRVAHFYFDVRTIRSCAHSLDAVIAEDDRVAVHGGFVGEAFDGTPSELRFADFFEFTAAGEISRRDTYFFAPAV